MNDPFDSQLIKFQVLPTAEQHNHGCSHHDRSGQYAHNASAGQFVTGAVVTRDRGRHFNESIVSNRAVSNRARPTTGAGLIRKGGFARSTGTVKNTLSIAHQTQE